MQAGKTLACGQEAWILIQVFFDQFSFDQLFFVIVCLFVVIKQNPLKLA